MKNVLIVGNSMFVGRAVCDTLCKHEDYKVSFIDTLGIDPEMIDFSGYDTVIMIVEDDHTWKTDMKSDIYCKFNWDLAYCTAIVAKAYGVSRFVILGRLESHMTTQPQVNYVSPNSAEITFSESKSSAEKKCAALVNDRFRICIVKLPTIYEDKKSDIVSRVRELLPSKKTKRINIEEVCSLINLVISE